MHLKDVKLPKGVSIVSRGAQTNPALVSVGEVRVTVDTDLTWSDGRRELTLPDLVIVETKSGSRPSGVDRLLWEAGHRPASISKYGTGLAALRGDLPANKWTRVLRRHFHTEEPARAA